MILAEFSVNKNEFASCPANLECRLKSFMTQLIFRFLVGGTIVSLIAVFGDILKSKSFAGLFGAPTAVALATLGLRIPYSLVFSSLVAIRYVHLFTTEITENRAFHSRV